MAAHSFALLSLQIPVQFLDSHSLSDDLATGVRGGRMCCPSFVPFVSSVVNEVQMLKITKDVKVHKGCPIWGNPRRSVRSDLA
jgi:hypothetical protein